MDLGRSGHLGKTIGQGEAAWDMPTTLPSLGSHLSSVLSHLLPSLSFSFLSPHPPPFPFLFRSPKPPLPLLVIKSHEDRLCGWNWSPGRVVQRLPGLSGLHPSCPEHPPCHLPLLPAAAALEAASFIITSSDESKA